MSSRLRPTALSSNPHRRCFTRILRASRKCRTCGRTCWRYCESWGGSRAKRKGTAGAAELQGVFKVGAGGPGERDQQHGAPCGTPVEQLVNSAGDGGVRQSRSELIEPTCKPSARDEVWTLVSAYLIEDFGISSLCAADGPLSKTFSCYGVLCPGALVPNVLCAPAMGISPAKTGTASASS